SAQPVRAFTPWVELLSLLLSKARTSAFRDFGKDLDIVHLPRFFRDSQILPDEILLALHGFGGKLRYAGSLPIFELARPLRVSLRLRVVASPLDGPTVFTDASSSTGQGAVVLTARTAPAAVLHVRSHSDVPGFFTTGNALADQHAGHKVLTVREADLHSTLHLGARALSRTCSIPMAVAREVVQACPHCNSAPALSAGVNPRGIAPLDVWQTDFTLEPRLAPRSWLAVTVDTASTVIVATQHGRAN
uniref:Retrovirus-related Pol polyprotein (Fragments) n=1 Tax=Gallus gallus TaxID=9031 RepID=POL1_CHICK|nr:RecName: Full=Retrovirus-related Pol polyprotein; Includes: RecName: Full=Reverse transcriptase; Includes: RecName: Full=Endonuclease [Gallus gallus]